MSFAGAAQRSVRWTENLGPVQWAVVPWLLLVWWPTIVVWYVTFGLLLVPYRLLRRGARKRNAEALRHREMLGAVEGRREEAS
jgi:hypothetical protein